MNQSLEKLTINLFKANEHVLSYSSLHRKTIAQTKNINLFNAFFYYEYPLGRILNEKLQNL